MAYNTTGKNQFESSTANYDVPDTGAYLYRKDRFQTKWDKSKSGKQTYVDEIFKNGKRKEKSVPAPNLYNPDKIKVELPSTVQ